MIDTEALRKKVLDLAIQGKLTEQLSSDGDADALIYQIAEEKAELIKKGQIPKEKNLPSILDVEIPFGIPNSWRWVRVQDVASYITDYVANGSFATLKAHTKTYNEHNYAVFVRTIDFSSEFKYGCSYIDKESYDFLKKSQLFGGELILPNIGASIGKAFVMPNLGMPMSLAPNSILLKFIQPEMNDYFSFVVKSTYGQQLLAKTQGGCTTAKFSKTDLRSLIVPLPTISEIKRIVNIVNEICAILDNIDSLQSKCITDSAVLKSKLLDAAIQGKLVEQRAEEGTAEELYKQIRAEKQKLINEGKIKKEKPLPKIEVDEIPFDIPSSWIWCRLKCICTKIIDGDHNPPEGNKVPTEFLMISAKNVNNDSLVDLDKVRYLTEDVFQVVNKRTNVEINDVFFTIVGSMGRSCVYKGGYNICLQRSVSAIKTKILPKYLKYVLDSPFIQKYLYANAYGTAQKGFYLNQVEKLLIPLPPLAEQRRIVAKIEELLPLCERLAECREKA